MTISLATKGVLSGIVQVGDVTIYPLVCPLEMEVQQPEIIEFSVVNNDIIEMEFETQVTEMELEVSEVASFEVIKEVEIEMEIGCNVS